MSRTPTLVIHGGAGPIARGTDREPEARRALEAALGAGRDVLSRGGPALEAAVRAVESMEASGQFNAGKGAVLASDGRVSHDAAVMDGRTRRVGGVAALPGFAHPVLVALRVCEATNHVLLAGEGAIEFALSHGFARAPEDYFVPVRKDRAPQSGGTVGAVALDATGALAAATSTGGTAGKLPGRVGDSPICGAGTYADAQCAVSATGTGEFFVRAVFGYRLATLVAAGQPLEVAARLALDEVVTLGGSGGCVALTTRGEVAMPFVSPGMFRGCTDLAGRSRVAIFPDEP